MPSTSDAAGILGLQAGEDVNRGLYDEKRMSSMTFQQVQAVLMRHADLTLSPQFLGVMQHEIAATQ